MSSTVRPAPLMTRLNDEWVSSFADREHAFGALGSRSCGELLAEIRQARGEDQDVLLYELLQLAHTGDVVAERLLVQVLIPAAQRMSNRVRSLADLDRSERVGYAIGQAWESMNGYPMHLRRRVHANLTMGLLKRLSPEKTQNDRIVADRTFPIADEALEVAAGSWGGPDKPVEVLAADLFAWAVDTGVLTSDETALLAQVAFGEKKQTDLASELGVSVDCLNKRVARIRGRLKVAYQHHF